MKTKRIQPHTIISSHTNADFDAVASMLAAQKLYPDAVVIFPGSQEKTLRDFFVSSVSYLFNMEILKNIDFSRTRQLVLVDTRQPSRIPDILPLLSQKGLEIDIYDHHPPADGDIKGTREFTEATGATVTILCRRLRQKGIPITPEEATILALGIYEDTGSFTYNSTTEADFNAAAYLLTCGAGLDTISNLISREIKTDQVALLNELLNEKTVHFINGVTVHISTISSPNYIQDLASIVQKVMKIENLEAFFAVVLMDSKIVITARSRIPEVHVGRILSALDGGGHASAASAGIKGKTLVQVEQLLMDLLKKEIKPTHIARELMSVPPLMITADTSCRDAGIKMTRYNVNTLLVSSPRYHHRVIGYITRQIIEKALYHQLEHVAVHEYMSSDISAISADAGLDELETRVMDETQRLLPVMDKDQVIGVVTRTDLLNFMFNRNKDGKPSRRGGVPNGQSAKKRNIRHLVHERLDPGIVTLLQEIGSAGDERDLNIFVVGGFVRDLMLYRKSDDIDVVVEGDGIAFAQEFAVQKNGRCSYYREFGTAVIILPDGFKIDVASARLEYYTAPAALPTVEMSSIKRDLFRRDFTINTLAIRLNAATFGTLIDFFGAQRDLKDKTIRTIHNLSFVEDPTRVFRAIKFANRFDFSIGKPTRNLIDNAVKINFFKQLSGRRVFSELKQILEEENPIPAIQTLRQYELDKTIHPSLCLDDAVIDTLAEVLKVVTWHDLLYISTPCRRWAIYFMAIIRKCDYKAAREICTRLGLTPTQSRMVLKERFKAQERLYILENRFPPTKSGLYALLHIFKPEHLLFIMACTHSEQVRKGVSFFYTRLKDTRPAIQGRDLIALGLKPGPAFQKIIQTVLDARLDGVVTNKKEELDFVKKHFPPDAAGISDKSVD